MKKSGLADSPFFSILPTPSEQVPAAPVVAKQKLSTEKVATEIKSSPSEHKVPKTEQPSNRDTVIPRHHDTMTPRNRDTTVSSNHGTVVEIVRKAVKEFGKEAATHRFTAEEKRAVLDIIYSYKGSGIKTSENEVARIAINYIIEDYKQNGRNSVLDQVLRALNE